MQQGAGEQKKKRHFGPRWDTAVGNLVTVTGCLSIYANSELASLGAAFSSLAKVTAYTQ